MRRCALVLLPLLLACAGEDAPQDAGIVPDAGLALDAGETEDAGPRPCESWLVEYDLEGSEFEIRNTPFGAGDAVNQVGPGRVQLRFPGGEAGPEPGLVSMVQFELQMQFEVQMVETDVVGRAGPDDCGVASGTATSSVVGWQTPMIDFRSQGTITCRGGEFLCGVAELPEDEPVVQDTTTDQPLMPFVFDGEGDYTTFTMAEVEVPNDQVGDTFLRLSGRQVTRQCVPQPVDCE